MNDQASSAKNWIEQMDALADKKEAAKIDRVTDRDWSSGPEVSPATKSATVKHAHYHKDVSKLASVDVYRVLDVFGVTHPCAQHAAKKVLCAGTRGAKDIDKDIQEAIDTLVRWQAMRKEDAV